MEKFREEKKNTHKRELWRIEIKRDENDVRNNNTKVSVRFDSIWREDKKYIGKIQENGMLGGWLHFDRIKSQKIIISFIRKENRFSVLSTGNWKNHWHDFDFIEILMNSLLCRWYAIFCVVVVFFFSFSIFEKKKTFRLKRNFSIQIERTKFSNDTKWPGLDML